MGGGLSTGIAGSLAALLMASLVVMGSPGPSTISATAVGAAFGLRGARAYLAGLIAGTIAVLGAVAAGLVALLLAIPALAPLLIVLSAVYLVYLSYRIATAPPLAGQDGKAATPSFAGGFLLAIANPKAYVAIAAVYAGATFAGLPPAAEAAIKIATLSLMIVLIHVFWLVAGAAFAKVLRHPVASRIVNVAFATLLVASAALALGRQWPGG